MSNTNIIVTQPVNAELQAQLKKATAAIDKRIKKLGGNPAYVFKAQAAFKYNELDGNTVNIQTCLDLAYLIKALAKMKRVEEEYNSTMSSLGIKEYPVCRWFGIPISAYIEDLEFLVRRLANKSLLDTLTKKKEELAQFLSAEEKLTNILTDLKTLMNE